MGAVRRLEVTLAAGFSLAVQEQAGAESGVAVGDPVVATWDPEQSVLLEDVSGDSVPGVAMAPPS